MNKKVTAIVLSLGLTLVILVAVFAPALAYNNDHGKKDSSIIVTYGQHGEVILQLPSGTPSHPTNLRLIANDYDKRSHFGAYDTLVVALWIPAMNAYVPVAHINSISNPDLDAFLQTLYANTPVWNPVMHNIFDTSALSVWRKGDTIMANLTSSVTVTLPFNLMVNTPYVSWGDLTFVLPPMTLTFQTIGHGSPYEEALTLTSPPFSGYTLQIKSWMSPAWVKAQIPTWVSGAWLECSGHICTNLVSTSTPPAT